MNIAHRICPDLKTYAAAQKFCETAAMNGFTTGRLVEPRTQSFNDNVFAESLVVFGYPSWIGINVRKGPPWVYTSGGNELVFENWYPFEPTDKALTYCISWNKINGRVGKWLDYHCNTKLHFVCEFV